MASSLRPAFAAVFVASVLGAGSAYADVFSSQNFSGGETKLDQLPGVNLNAAPGIGTGFENCAEDEMPSYSSRSLSPQKSTTCRIGNFSITSTNSGSSSHYDTTYGGNPPPWVPNWRP